MTVVVGTAGHIDHGKTALLRALTGIDADRLPEERRRGMTIDVGYAHIGLADGSEIDFVDVPGHDKLVGNMLVGAGEIDAVMLVVAADDGPRTQTIEHLALLDALGLEHGIVVITKTDVVGAARTAEVRQEVERLLAPTSLAGLPVFAASSVTGSGIEGVRVALEALRDRVVAASSTAPDATGDGRTRLAIDRAFQVKGRGLVVTGTLRGGPIARNATLRLVPGEASARARELQVHGRAVEVAGPGRTAINLAGVEPALVHRGAVLTTDPGIAATDRLLVRLNRSVPDRTRGRLHLGTAAADGTLGRSGRDAIDLDRRTSIAILRLAEPIAAGAGDRFVLRMGGESAGPLGGVVLDVAPARGFSRRRQTRERVAGLVAAVESGDRRGIRRARLELHGALAIEGVVALAGDISGIAGAEVVEALGAASPTDSAGPSAQGPSSARVRLADVRTQCARTLRRLATLRRDEAAAAAEGLIERLVTNGQLVREGDRVGLPGSVAPGPPAALADPVLAAAMERLASALAVAGPPGLRDAARGAGCTEPGIRELVRTGRIVLLDDDLAYEADTYRSIEAQALDLARREALTPANLRDATGTSRKYVMAILADLDRRGILRRTEHGHVPGPRAARGTTTAGGTVASATAATIAGVGRTVER